MNTSVLWYAGTLVRWYENKGAAPAYRTYLASRNMLPPFFDTRLLDAISLDEIVPLIDQELLFSARWQLRQGADAPSWEARKRESALPAFERILALVRARRILEPKVLYGYFRCRREGSALLVEGKGRAQRFAFPRERAAPNRSLADFFPEGFVAIQLATVGKGAAREGARLFSEGLYTDAFFLKGFAAEAAEATAAFGHAHIRRELGAAADCGERFSLGYPPCPDLFDQRRIAALLTIARAGVSLTKTCQLVPEHSTTAFISVAPEAVHFRP